MPLSDGLARDPGRSPAARDRAGAAIRAACPHRGTEAPPPPVRDPTPGTTSPARLTTYRAVPERYRPHGHARVRGGFVPPGPLRVGVSVGLRAAAQRQSS